MAVRLGKMGSIWSGVFEAKKLNRANWVFIGFGVAMAVVVAVVFGVTKYNFLLEEQETKMAVALHQAKSSVESQLQMVNESWHIFSEQKNKSASLQELTNAWKAFHLPGVFLSTQDTCEQISLLSDKLSFSLCVPFNDLIASGAAEVGSEIVPFNVKVGIYQGFKHLNGYREPRLAVPIYLPQEVDAVWQLHSFVSPQFLNYLLAQSFFSSFWRLLLSLFLIVTLLVAWQKLKAVRKNSQSDFLQLRRKLENTFDVLTVGIGITELDGVLFYSNSQLQGFINAGKVSNLSEIIAFPLKGFPFFDKKTTLVLEEGSPKDLEVSVMRFDALYGEPSLLWIVRDVTKTNRMINELAVRESQYRLLTENVEDVIWTLDNRMRIQYISPSIQRLLGVQADVVIQHGLDVILAKHQLEELMSFCKQVFQLGVSQVIELEISHQYKGERWVEIKASVFRNERGEAIGLLGIVRDITERRQQEAERRQAAVVFENSFEGIFISDELGAILKVNRAFTAITGYNDIELIGQNIDQLNSGRHPKSFFSEMKKLLLEEGVWQGEIWSRRKNGEIYPQRLSLSSIRDSQGEIQKLIGIFADITEKKQSEARIKRLAYYDPLCDLPNRTLFQEKLVEAIFEAKKKGEWLAVLFVDLDRFKTVNDTLGHPAGDALLKLVSQRIRDSLDERDLVARMGGDEFIILLSGLTPGHHAVEMAKSMAEKVLEKLIDPFDLSNREVFIGASIGISFSPKDGIHATELVKNADLALYHAKSRGKNTYDFYNEHMNHREMNRLELESLLRRAIKDEQLQLFYQPQINIQTGKLCGAEALMRWYAPHKGLVLPSNFIALAEETGVIVQLGAWAFEAACKQAKAWDDAGYQFGRLGINISVKQLGQSNLIQEMERIIQETGVRPQLIEIELTETVLMENVERTIMLLGALKKLGIQVAIDDFGTGYSSLNYLKQLPIDRLKIDQTFVKDITLDPDAAEVVSAIIAMAQNLRLEVIAEGVETWGQLEFLRFHQCEEVQGFLLSRPLEADAMTLLLAEEGYDWRKKPLADEEGSQH